jgi:hypothetical protein
MLGADVGVAILAPNFFNNFSVSVDIGTAG